MLIISIRQRNLKNFIFLWDGPIKNTDNSIIIRYRDQYKQVWHLPASPLVRQPACSEVCPAGRANHLYINNTKPENVTYTPIPSLI
ncbi:MAG: hypothetical protein A2167_05585 [Planctomycetes bacterium RBG_13_46_10]|nr:MAG: hypothetical protein A2167_05585 [Planctomycetes bacterium RBG_13_46_10]